MESNLASLLRAWRLNGWPVVHVRHDSTEPSSTYRPGQPGNAFKPEVAPLNGEAIIAKRTNSAFIGTDLEPWLRGREIGNLVICGVLIENSVDATVRVAANLGFSVMVPADGVAAVDRVDRNGRRWPAEDVQALWLSVLDGEYATVATTADLLAS